MYVISSINWPSFKTFVITVCSCPCAWQIFRFGKILHYPIPNIYYPIYYPIYSLITALLPDAMRDYSTKKLPSPSAHRPWLSLMCSSNLYQSPPSKRRPPAPNIEYAGRSSPLWPSSATSLAASTARKYSQWLQYASIKCDLITTASPLYPGRVF